ncbi:mid1-interacting protein 1-like [Culicoides brevitarsis]|uniref:mid1-interacting protein 1-like n=1 Tax=Culicoides brevitarsis TaxID=469753 RepID=UPI00307B19EE
MMYTDLENSRTKRRIARHDDQEFSNQSILNSMEKFVNTVNSMNETILVPSRLMDRQVGDETDTVPPASPKHHNHHHHSKSGGSKKESARDLLKTSDLYNLYNMLNSVKVDLLWGRQDEAMENVEDAVAALVLDASATSSTEDATQEPQTPTTGTSSSSSSVQTKGHFRRPSTASMMSTASAASTISDNESEISNENDSGIESETTQEQDKSDQLAKQFRTHLLGLYKCLGQMTEAANYLTVRYQSDVGSV